MYSSKPARAADRRARHPSQAACILLIWFPSALLGDPTWPLLARPLLLCKLLDQVVDADVFDVLLEFLVNLQQKQNKWTDSIQCF